jgi:hypothetical protein
MRIESSVVTVSWIPSEAVKGMTKAPFELGLAHYDPPPPDELPRADIERLGREDRFRFCNELRAWIEVADDGRITDFGQEGCGHIWNTFVKVGRPIAFQAVGFPDLRPEPEVGDGWVRFRQTAGGRTGVPAPRRVSHPPFVQFRAPSAWTTLSLTLHGDGRVEHSLVGASPFPRHWVYGGDGRLVEKTGMIDFKEWYRTAFGKHSPWGDEESPTLVSTVESALERQLSVQLMQGKSEPEVRKVKAGTELLVQGTPGHELFLVLDGMVVAEVDGKPVAELGPGALLGERAVLEGGLRTATIRALTGCKVAVAPADTIDRALLEELREGHRREDLA